MNVRPARCFRLLVVALLAFSSFGPAASAATDKKGSSPAASATSKVREAVPVEVPKSVFNALEGRNPFFPASRVQPLIPDATGGKAPPTPKPPLELLVLNGIVPEGNRPTAMINGHTFEEGETAEVKLPNGTKIQIKCEEIRKESVIIFVDGVKRELTLRFGA